MTCKAKLPSPTRYPIIPTLKSMQVWWGSGALCWQPSLSSLPLLHSPRWPRLLLPSQACLVTSSLGQTLGLSTPSPTLCCFFLTFSTVFWCSLPPWLLTDASWKAEEVGVNSDIWTKGSFDVLTCFPLKQLVSVNIPALNQSVILTDTQNDFEWDRSPVGFWICTGGSSFYLKPPPSSRSLGLEESTILTWFGFFYFDFLFVCLFSGLHCLFCFVCFIFHLYFVPTFSFIVHH